MKFRWDSKYWCWGVTAFLAIAASMLFYFGIFRMEMIFGGINKLIQILMPIIFGAVIAYLINPILNFYEHTLVYPFLEKKKIGNTRRLGRVIRYSGIFVALAFMMFVLYAIISMILPEIIKSIVNIINNFPLYVESVQRGIQHMLENNQEIYALVADFIDRYSVKIETYLTQDILPQLQNVLRQFSSGVWDVLIFLKNALIGIIVSVYILADKEIFNCKFKRLIYAVFSRRQADTLIENIRFTDKTFGGFISGKLLDSFIIGILCYIGALLLKFPYSVLVSVIVGVTNVIPFFGPYMGAIPCAFLILLVSPLKCLYFIIFIFVLQQFDGNILGPKILGDSTGLSSFMVIVAILIGGGLFGVLGMFIGVPVCAVIYHLCNRAMERSLKKKNLPEDLNSYNTKVKE